MSVLEISRLRKLVDAERANVETKVPSQSEVAAVVNETSMLGCAVMLTLSSLEAHCDDFPDAFVYGKDGGRDWTFDGSGDFWRVDHKASRPSRMSDRSADAEDFFTASFLPCLLSQLDMNDSAVAQMAFMSVSDICRNGDASRLSMIFQRMPAHTVISVMHHATTLEGVLGIRREDIVEQVSRWYALTERPLPYSGIATVFETAEPDLEGNLKSHSLWLRSCLDTYHRRNWPMLVQQSVA